ncbi:hypothetical protein [Calothrix rhizosoleniae]|uniref:hypothetical protein n=1 Tax=Calothrix rhizosoleniae TaxID=888997 RepID=UPI001178BCBE|nr:hypothetical protein [Calothrix rhizosoleniae]
MLLKIASNTYLKPLTRKQSTPLNEIIGISAIWRLVSMVMLQNPPLIPATYTKQDFCQINTPKKARSQLLQ